MKNIKNLKKKIFGITLVVGLLVLSIVGTTMAYFTDTDTKTNVFTSGNVKIQFTSNVLIDDDDNNTNSTVVRPTQKLADAAVVKNIGSEDAYVGVVVTFNKYVEDVADLFNGIGGAGTENAAKYTVAYLADNNTNTTTVFVAYKDAIATTAENNTVKFFNDITVPGGWDEDDMDIFGTPGLTITVKAYAVQSYGLTTGGAVAALQEAFADVWGKMPTGN